MNQRLPARRFVGKAAVPVLLLVSMLAIVEATDVDLTIQDRFYNASTRRWWVDAREPVGRAVF